MTRLAVISDIHGNYMALEAFLEYLRKHPVDGILCLGDYVTDSPYPERTMRLIYEMRESCPCVMIRGNREEYLLKNEKKSQGWKPSSANGALYYTALHLSREDMAFLEELPREEIFSKEGCPDTYLCHGTPGQIRGNVTFGRGTRVRALGAIEQRYLFGGHSHHQEIFTRGEKTYLNPGSLGLAIDGVGGRAQFALVTGQASQGSGSQGGGAKGSTSKDGTWRMELLSIPYDVEGFLRDFQTSGLEENGRILCRAIKKTLVTGINYFYESILEVQKESPLPLAQIPESVWETVARRLEL